MIQTGVLQLILFPFALKKELSSLRHFSMLGFISVIYTIIIICIQAEEYHEVNYDPDTFKVADFNITTIQGFAVAMFSYCCHVTIFKAGRELKNPCERRTNKIFGRMTIICMILYVAMAAGGYWAVCDSKPQMIILRNKLVNSDDILMVIARFGICINLCVALCSM